MLSFGQSFGGTFIGGTRRQSAFSLTAREHTRRRSTRCRLGPDGPSGRWRSAPSSPSLAGSPPASCTATGAGGEQQPGRDAHVLWVCKLPRRRAPRQPADRIAPAPARRVRELPARRPLSSTSAPAVDHAAALWQLCCRIGRTTTVACQRVGSYARCHHLRPRATGSILGTNSRATQRAGELAAADPAYRARRGRRLELAARSSPEVLLCGASFGHELERALVRGKLVGCGAIQRAVRRLCDAPCTLARRSRDASAARAELAQS